MKFQKFLSIFVLLLVSSTFFLAGCGDNTPSEEELQSSGNSLELALPSFKNLTDNYMYKEYIHQTNGEDWFSFRLVKLDDEDIYLRSTRINSNVGWEYVDTIFTDYADLTDKDYSIYVKQPNSSSYCYYNKYLSMPTDEEFTKYYYPDNTVMNIDENASRYGYDYSFFNTDNFEYFTTTDDDNNTVPCWKVKTDLLTDSTFKTTFGTSINQFSSDTTRLDYVYLYVQGNKVVEMDYGYYSHITSNVDFIFHNKVYFFYTGYTFDEATLTTGFTLYQPD